MKKSCRWCNKEFEYSHENQQYCKICNEDIPFYVRYSRRHPERIKKSVSKYREKNLELCRKRTRENQIKLNDEKRFGGLRIKVLERDNYLCQMCKKDISGKNMACIHHKDENKTNNTMKNMISLCKACHPKVHYHLEEHQYTSHQLKELWDKRGVQYFNR